MRYFIYIVLGFIPSIIWLMFYLKKDQRPEPKSMIIAIFTWGMLTAPLIIIAELALNWILTPTANPLTILFSGGVEAGFLKKIIAFTLIPAVAEEYLKYSVVKIKVIQHSEFDEPTDAMIYCIISGLGFAAVENLLALFNFPYAPTEKIIGIIGFRFIGATLLHALASAVVGYWLALGLLNTHQRKRLILKGLALAVIFHSCYNYLILAASPESTAQQYAVMGLIAILLTAIALYVSDSFRKLKKQQSICKI